jgi:hypothetical protein
MTDKQTKPDAPRVKEEQMADDKQVSRQERADHGLLAEADASVSRADKSGGIPTIPQGYHDPAEQGERKEPRSGRANDGVSLLSPDGSRPTEATEDDA